MATPKLHAARSICGALPEACDKRYLI